MVPHRKEAGADFAIGGNTNPAAMSAEGMRNRRNDSDFADAVIETIAPRGFAAGVWNFDERPVFAHALENFVERNYSRRRPYTIFFKRHEFDEANNHAFFAGEHAKRDDLIFVEAAHQHAIDFQRPKPCAARGANSGEHVIESAGHAGDAREAIGIDRVHADGDAVQAGILERLRHIGEQMAVGGDASECRGRRRSAACAASERFAHKINNPLPQQRLPARQPYLRDSQRNHHARHAQIIVKRQLSIKRAFVARPAIDTLVVAAVSDRDPQIGDGAAEFVGKRQLLAPGYQLFSEKKTAGGNIPAAFPFQCFFSYEEAGGAGVSTCTLGANLLAKFPSLADQQS